jgi:RecJ-like exonuclease
MIEFTFENDDGEETVHEFPSKKEVCHRCDGHGKHTNPAIDGNGITASEWADEWDEESRENYMSGVYDVTCETCNGLNVVDVIDESRFTEADKVAYEEYLEYQKAEAYYAAECAAEQRMGC